MKKYCTRCGKPFAAVGREVICPACKAAAAEETKRAAVLKAKRASWTGESVPVRISGRASTIIREYGKQHNLPFAQALDALLQASDYVKSSGKAWGDITPYKSQRRDRHATDAQDTAQEVKDVPQDAPQEEVKQEEVKQAAKQASKATASKATSSKASASKASASKAAGKAAKQASYENH